MLRASRLSALLKRILSARQMTPLAAALAAWGLVAASAQGDDRDLLRLSESGAADPYVFVIFDTSASMTHSPVCTPSDTINDIDPFDSMCTQECTLDDATCERICPSKVPALEVSGGKGCREYAIADPDNPITELEEIILDNDATSGVTISGTWTSSSLRPFFKGSDYLFDRNTGEDGPPGNQKSVTYSPNITNAGTYMIYMTWVDRPVLGTNVMVDVTHIVDGSVVTETVVVDQTFTVDTGTDTEFDGWNLIGTFELNASSGTVKIRNEMADNFVLADAVRWVRISVPPCLDATDLIYRCQQPICPEGGCYTPLNGDDPNSKFYQAKQALYEALDSVSDVHFGFGSYEQDNARLHAKHWLYRVRETIPGTTTQQTLPLLGGAGGTAFLEVGDDEVFGNYSTSSSASPQLRKGDGWDCYTSEDDVVDSLFPEFDSSRKDQQVACNRDNPADLSDVWEMFRAHRIPKLGYKGTFRTTVWYRDNYDNDEIYALRYSDNGDMLGADPFSANYEIFDCEEDADSDIICDLVNTTTGTLYYDRVSDYAAWDGITFRHPIANGGLFYLQGNINALDGFLQPNQHADRSTCFGLEPNADSNFEQNTDWEEGAGWPEDSSDIQTDDIRDDLWYDYNIKWPTTQDSRGDDLNLDGTADSPRIGTLDSTNPASTLDNPFDSGDRIPLDWLTNNVDEIKRRLAPNVVDGTDPLDFRIAVYFEDAVGPAVIGNAGTEEDEPLTRRLRLLNDDSDGDTTDDERPLIPQGRTPLGEALADFKVWYAGSEDIPDGADPDDPQYQGWADVASILDTDFPCRQKFILLLTDGVDTCFGECKDPFENPCTDSFDNDPCVVPGDLLDQEQVKTYVVGFGVSAGSSLDCIAENGGTDEPLLPRNKEELVSALESILADVQAEQRTFASASIPAVQSTAADKIFLSSFTPLPFDPLATPPANPAPGFWPGRIDAFRAPLPLTSDNRPDVDRTCENVESASDDLQAACHLWEAGKVLCEQIQNNERTVLYGMEHTAGTEIPGAARPGTLREFKLPQVLIDDPTGGYDASHPDFPLVYDLAKEFLTFFEQVLYFLGFFDNQDIADRFSEIIDPVTGLKDLPLDFVGQVDACDTDNDDEADAFALGDIFHASPVAISGPSNFTYFANDQCGPAQRTDIPNNCVSPTALAVDQDRGYRQFAADHVWRRRMLAAPTNDGQLHFFDTGIRQLVPNDFTTQVGDTIELFNDGSGKEIFSYIPRMLLPVLQEQVEGEDHVFSMDGTVTVADVYIDPGDTVGGQATELDRAWRTVIVGGMREAGDIFPDADDVEGFRSGYFALDVTQPDALSERTGNTDPTLVPCENAGCSESTTPNDEFPPSCMVLDAQGILTETSDCPYRIDPAPAEDPQFPAELWTFRDSWLIEDPSATGEYLEFYLDEDDGGDLLDPTDDENGYGVPDLADTWSRPVVTQIAVCPEGATNCVFGRSPTEPAPNGSDLITKHVAVFGGGMDPANKDPSNPRYLEGAYLYMVDVETGFPIYKRKLCPDAANDVCGTGAAPADPTVLDVDRDGIADAIYIGTTDGFFYKVKLSTEVGDVVPNLADIDIKNGQLIRDPDGDGIYETWADTPSTPLDPATSAMSTLCGAADPCAQRVTDSAWDPFPILDTGGSPIHYAASAFLVPERDQFAFTVGTGDREDLWSSPSEGGIQAEFYVIVDEDFTQADLNSTGACVADGTDPGQVPIDRDCLVSFSFTAEPFDGDVNLLTDVIDDTSVLPTGVDSVSEEMRPGWAMRFPTSDPLQNRVTSEAFAVSGVLVFSVFDPNIVAISSSGDDDDDDDDLDCGRSGTTRAFVVRASNGAPLVNLSALGDTGEGSTGDDDDDSSGGDDGDELTARDRFQEIAEFTTAPQIVRRQTPNKPGEDGGKTIQDAIDTQLRDSFRQAVLDHLPRGSRFNEAFEMVIVALRNSTGVNVYASIPIAMYPADWRDQ